MKNKILGRVDRAMTVSLLYRRAEDVRSRILQPVSTDGLSGVLLPVFIRGGLDLHERYARRRHGKSDIDLAVDNSETSVVNLL